MKRRTFLFVLATAGILFAAAGAGASDHAFVGAAKCKMCHKVQYNSWLETTHAKALDHAKAATDRTFEAACLKCHTTNADEALAGVQCEACHGPGADYKKMSIMKDQESAFANGLVVPTQATCNGCHTGEDHASKKDLEAEKANAAAIHAHKN
ncbi:MAG: hypothetical protein GY906_13785 [bacterium]|nr:hypothetical protein [bacterium]